MNYFKDLNGVRYELYQTNAGQNLNWLFFPGGPGADSCYFHGLVDILNLPGNIWLIDLPGNGGNVLNEENYNYDKWLGLYLETIKKFQNPIHVGHSFGGMLPLLFEECEKILKGLVILNSAPSLWMEEAQNYAKQFDLPDLSIEMNNFVKNPNQKTFDEALKACFPYYFPEKTLKKGAKVFEGLPFAYKPAVWWQKKALEISYSAKWIPKQVPTILVGGKYDCICPFYIFEKDERFQRKNIQKCFIENAGHLGWVENPEALKEAFQGFICSLSKVECRT